MTREEVKEAVREALAEHHKCYFREEDRQIIKDLIYGAKTLKKALIWAIVVALLVTVGVKYLPGFKG